LVAHAPARPGPFAEAVKRRPRIRQRSDSGRAGGQRNDQQRLRRKSLTAPSLSLLWAICKPRNPTLMVPNLYIELVHKAHRFIDSLIVVNAFDDFRHANKVLILAYRKNAICGHFFLPAFEREYRTFSHRRLTEKDAL